MQEDMLWGNVRDFTQYTEAKLMSVIQNRNDQLAVHALDTLNGVKQFGIEAVIRNIVSSDYPPFVKEFLLTALDPENPRYSEGYPSDVRVSDILVALRVGYYGYSIHRRGGRLYFEGLPVNSSKAGEWGKKFITAVLSRHIEILIPWQCQATLGDDLSLTVSTRDGNMIAVTPELSVAATAGVPKEVLQTVLEGYILSTWDPKVDPTMYMYRRASSAVSSYGEIPPYLRRNNVLAVTRRQAARVDGSFVNLGGVQFDVTRMPEPGSQSQLVHYNPRLAQDPVIDTGRGTEMIIASLFGNMRSTFHG